jgi:hypothetical protein
MHHAAAATSTKALIARQGFLTHNHFVLQVNTFNLDTSQIADYRILRDCSEGALWRAACTNKFGHLCQGHRKNMPTGTETMFFIPPNNIPKHKKPAYLRIVAAYWPKKASPQRVRFTRGGDKIEYHGEVSTKTADLTTVKCHINDGLSTPCA